MNKKIFTLLRYSLIALFLPALFAMQSCKSDNDDLLDEFYKFEDNMVMTYGESRDVLTLIKDVPEETLVLPAIVCNLSVTSENEDIISIDYNGRAKAVGIGSTNIIILNSEEEEIKRIPVTVNAPYKLKDIPEVLELSAGKSYDILDVTQEVNTDDLRYMTFTEDDPDGAVYIDRKHIIDGIREGEATITIHYAGQENPVKKFKVKVKNTVIALTCGDCVELNKYVDYKEMVSNNKKVADVVGGKIYALGPGKAKLADGIIVTVAPYTTTKLFPTPYLPYSIHPQIEIKPEKIKEEMNAYTLSYEGDESLDGVDYYALRYTNFGEGCTLIYYLRKGNWHYYLERVVVKSSKSAEDTYRSLLSTYEIGYVKSGVAESFESDNIEWDIIKLNNSWDTIEFLH